MEIDYKELLTGLLSTAYKMDNGKIEELLSAEGLTTETAKANLLNEDAQRVSLLKGQNADNKDSFNQGYAKGKKESLERFEADIKTEYGLDSASMGIDLIKEVTAKAGAASGSGEITEDVVKKHPTFLQMERDFKRQLTDKETEYTGKITDLENASKRNETFYGVRQKAVDLLGTFNPIEAKNPTVAATHRNMFVEALKAYDFEKQPDGSYLVLREGKREQDQHGHAVNFDDIVKTIAGNFYEFQANNLSYG